jgi:uncharacterized protein with HEPN domain
MSRSGLEVLRHILDESDYLLASSSELSREEFLRDETLKRAFVRSLEIIGEATKNVPPGIREASRAVEWKAMAGMRDRLIHHYFGVDYELVWDVIVHKIPGLREEILEILRAEKDREERS